jgi:hypothetical protein
LHPKYTWITYGWYSQASWINADIVNCTEDQLRMVLESGISVEVFPIPENTNAATVAGLVRSTCLSANFLIIDISQNSTASTDTNCNAARS